MSDRPDIPEEAVEWLAKAINPGAFEKSSGFGRQEFAEADREERAAAREKARATLVEIAPALRKQGAEEERERLRGLRERERRAGLATDSKSVERWHATRLTLLDELLDAALDAPTPSEQERLCRELSETEDQRDAEHRQAVPAPSEPEEGK